ncbi:Protein of unknown function [Gryllus bimaculatus]|nr:Protein of unknown function [Gryllus bimaculatus]
MLRVQQHLG